MFAVELNELALKSNFDLSKHLAHKSIDLPACYAFNNFAEFYYAMANTSNEACLLHLLATMIAYSVATYKKVTQQYAK